MDIIFGQVAGLDVHKKSIVVCVRKLQPQGNVLELVETFGTMTSDLLQMLDWLTAQQVTHVAMESTGVLWKPLWNILEGHFQLLLVNPRELKQVPGRKSDVRDSQWIAHLLQCGLLRSSFVPARPQRELRHLTRQRAQLVAETTRVANRIHKTLEDANIKLGAVASESLGKSGRAMLQAILAGERDSEKLANLAKGALRRGSQTDQGVARLLVGTSHVHDPQPAEPVAVFGRPNRCVQRKDRRLSPPFFDHGAGDPARCDSGDKPFDD